MATPRTRRQSLACVLIAAVAAAAVALNAVDIAVVPQAQAAGADAQAVAGGSWCSSIPPGYAHPPTNNNTPLTLQALIWDFHNSRSGCCFPSYETIAGKAECARSTVAEALKALEWAGVLIWQNRIARIQVRELDLFGRWASRWRVIRTSNAYVFRDPQPALAGTPTSKSENPAGIRNQSFPCLYW